jgi:hypothetical protein
MQDVLYEVFETDADLLEGKLVHQGFCRDVAETKMVTLFMQGVCSQDYMLINHNTQEIVCKCFTAATLKKRGECQQ